MLNLFVQLEKFRIERDVALTAIGHHSLTEVPKHDTQWKRDQLKRLKEHALEKVNENLLPVLQILCNI